MGWTTLRAQVVSTIYTALNTHLLGHLPPLSFSVHHFQKKRNQKRKKKKERPLCNFVNHLSLSLSIHPSPSPSLRCYAVLSSLPVKRSLCRVVSWVCCEFISRRTSAVVFERQLCVMWKHVTTHGGDDGWGGGCWWSKYYKDWDWIFFFLSRHVNCFLRKRIVFWLEDNGLFILFDPLPLWWHRVFMEKLLRRGLVIGRRIEDFFSLSIFNNMVSFFFIEKRWSMKVGFRDIDISFTWARF